MLCQRCGSNFDRAELRPPSRVLRWLAAPALLLIRSGAVRGEATALYCGRCRRQLNACLLFVAFFIFMMVTMFVLKKLGLTAGPVR